MQVQPTYKQNKTYECVAVDVHQQCSQWVVNENSSPLTQAEANVLTFKILAFMAFILVLKHIKREVIGRL